MHLKSFRGLQSQAEWCISLQTVGVNACHKMERLSRTSTFTKLFLELLFLCSYQKIQSLPECSKNTYSKNTTNLDQIGLLKKQMCSMSGQMLAGFKIPRALAFSPRINFESLCLRGSWHPATSDLTRLSFSEVSWGALNLSFPWVGMRLSNEQRKRK